NYIGTDVTGTQAIPNGSFFGNYGVEFADSASNNTLSANLIRFNRGPGVVVSSGSGDRITANFIADNGHLGIDLNHDGVTPNDTKDPDTGPNALQNFPMLNNFSAAGVISG